ncbi:glutamate--cysteine ligase [Longispora urticae]
MGRDVQQREFTHDDRQRYRQKVRRCLDVFALMLDELRFDADRPLTGLEIELNLVDGESNPAMKNAEILTYMASPMLQTELGQFNLEINVPPRLIAEDGLAAYEAGLRATLAQLEERAAKADAGVALIGILPTLEPEHTVLENLSANPRYRLLNSQIMNERGENMEIDIRGVERFTTTMDSIAPEAACTSIQFHLQVSPEQFPAYWNASQAIAAVQLAVGSNSPYAFGHRLWSETRIALFTQATDVRPEELRVQGVRPRVWFGERWITSIFDLFEENVRYFPPLLPLMEAEDPLEVLRSGGIPRLGELRLHNGTVYRWNRPVYDVMDGRPHLRVENRVLPAGPTVVDMMANAALYYGLVRTLAEEDRPVWTKLPFTAAEANFYSAARRGIEGVGQWPGEGEGRFSDLLLERLLPLAYEGLDRFGVDPEVRDRLLGIIERRCALRRTGATWQTAMVNKLEKSGLDRSAALREMLARYRRYSAANAPVHTWPLE